MREFLAMFHSIWMVAILLTFLGIVAWAYSNRRKQSLEEAGRQLLDDDDSVRSRN